MTERLWRSSAFRFLALGVACAWAGFGTIGSSAQAASLSAGAAKSVITPWLGTSLAGSMRDKRATHIHDELHARCLVLDDGTTKLVLVVVDNCLVPREIFDTAKARLLDLTGIPTENMLMSATHTHTAPTVTPVFQSPPNSDYLEFLTSRIVDGVRRALNNLEPAQIGWAVGEEPDQVFNRRWHLSPDVELVNPLGFRDKVRMNPPAASAQLLRPAGPIDPQVPVVSVQSSEGRPISILANYALHYVGGTGGGHVSADYFAMFADRIQELIGADRLEPPFVGIMSNGTSGDINNIDFTKKRERQAPYEQMRQVASDVADAAFAVYPGIKYDSKMTLASAQKEITLGVRKPAPAEIKRAEDILEAARKAGRTDFAARDEIYAQETLDMSLYPDEVEILVQAFRIGDLAIVALPTETFVEIGLELKKRSPFKTTFIIELANGYNGYLPTPEQHELGGYETWRAKSSYLAEDSSPKVVATAMELLNSLK